jgi:hypothetical protein
MKPFRHACTDDRHMTRRAKAEIPATFTSISEGQRRVLTRYGGSCLRARSKHVIFSFEIGKSVVSYPYMRLGPWLSHRKAHAILGYAQTTCENTIFIHILCDLAIAYVYAWTIMCARVPGNV